MILRPRALLLASLLWLLAVAPALAQTGTGWTYGYVPTVAQWDNAFRGKQDYLGAPPLLTTGGSMTGPLITTASIAGAAGFNVPQGVVPSSPNNGDVWSTPSGFFARIAGVTYNLISGGCGTCALLGSANTFTASPQTVSGLTTTSPGWYAQITGDSTPRVRVGLNATDIPSIAFGPGNAVRDTFIERVSAATLRLGAPDAASPVAQMLGVQNVVAGTSNTAGTDLTITGSRSTGNAAGGGILFQIAPAGGSGTSQNALISALKIITSGAESRVGISTTTPQAKLHVNRNAAGNVTPFNSTSIAQFTGADGQLAYVQLDGFTNTSGGTGGANGPAIISRLANGTGASPAAIGAGSVLLELDGEGWDGTAWNGSGSDVYIILNSAQIFASGQHGTYIAMGTTPLNTAGGGTEALRIQPSGGVSIGNSAADPGIGGIIAAGNLTTAKSILTNVTTVALLPSCTSGLRSAHQFVTDANATFTAGIGAAVVGGGANNVPVTCDGTSWRIG